MFLSATIPNAREFAEWVVHVHSQPCHVVYTEYRPTPLKHYLFPSGGDGLHLVVDKKRRFLEKNFARAMAAVQADEEDESSLLNPMTSAQQRRARKGKGGAGSRGVVPDLKKLVRLILQLELQPVIVFAFSKRDCEAYAASLNSSKDVKFNSEDEAALVTTIYTAALEALSEEDRALPALQMALPLLRRGIGFHHGGLLPILKEVVEILFQEGLIKVRDNAITRSPPDNPIASCQLLPLWPTCSIDRASPTHELVLTFPSPRPHFQTSD